MLRLAFKAIKHNPKRLILTAMSVVLGVALVTTIHTFTNSIDRQFSGMIDEVFSGSDISIAQTGSLNDLMGPVGNPFPASSLDDVRAIPGIAIAEGGVEARPTILTPEGELPTINGGPPNIFTNWIDDTSVSQLEIVDGRAPAAPGEASIDLNGMERLGYEVGDTLHVATDAGIVDYTIVGTTWFGITDNLSGATLVQLTLPDMWALTGLDGQFTRITAFVAPGADVEQVVAQINDNLPSDTTAISTAAVRELQKEALRAGLKYVDIFTLVFALIAIFVGAFIIANTFRIIVTQRTREIGLVRALGARPSQVRGQILLEALIVAIVASIIGIALGYVFALGLTKMIDSSGTGLTLGTPTLPTDAVVWGATVGLAVTLIAALLPAIHASQISPMEALRESATMSRKPLGTRNAVGGGLVAMALVGIGLGLFGTVGQPGVWVGVAAAVMVIGVALLSAQLLTWLAKILYAPMGRLFGVNGRLAVGNVRREPRRAGITATALMIGVLLLALVSTLTETFKVAAAEQVRGRIVADLMVSGNPTSGVPINVSLTAQEAILATGGVDHLTTIRTGQVTVDGKSMTIAAVDPGAIHDVFTVPTTPGVESVGEGVYISPKVQHLGFGVGDQILVDAADATLTLTVTGTYDTEGDTDLLVNYATGERLDDTLINAMAFVTVKTNADVVQTLVAVRKTLDEFPLLTVDQPDQLVKQINDAFDQLLLIITVMLSASLGIAILGVANTLFLSVTERTREIGLLRAVGVRRRDVWTMITLESVAIATFGAFMGIVLGVGLGAALVTALSSFGFSTPVIPWIWLGIYAVMAVLAGIVAAIVPAWLASRVNILKAVATD